MLSVMLNKHVEYYTQYISRYFNDKTLPYSTGLEIKADEVFSICPGKVISVNYTSLSTYFVSVLVNEHQMVIYANLKSVSVKVGQEISFRTFIGNANKFVRFEYCTDVQDESKWVVRTKSITMYKHNPLGILTGQIKLKVPVDNVHVATGDEEMIPLDKHVSAEFTGNRGEES